MKSEIHKDHKTITITQSVTTEDRQEIHYDHTQGGFDTLIVIAPGFFNSKASTLLKQLGQEFSRSYDVLLLDFRGHGQNPGHFYWTSKEYLDLKAVFDCVRGKYRKRGMIGFSLGAATSLITAAKYDFIDSLIAVSAPTEFGKIDYHFWDLDIENDIFFNLTGKGRAGKGIRPGPFWLKKDKPIDVVAKITCPILFIHGEGDWLIKPWHSQALYNKVKGKKEITIIKNGPHAEYLIRKNKEETVRTIHDWFKKTLPIA